VARGYMMNVGICRVSVQSDHDESPVVVDLALPRGTALGAMLPSIVDIVCHGQTTDPVNGAAQRWQLSRIGGPVLDDSMTLQDIDIRDGELLVLSTDDTPVPAPTFEPARRAVATASESATRAEGLASRVGAAGCLWTAAVSGILLCWLRIHAPSGPQVFVAGFVAGAAATVAAVAGRMRPEPLPCLTMSLIAVVFATVTGYLAVPGGPSAPKLCLAAVAGYTLSVVLLRVISCGTVFLTAAAGYLATVGSVAAATAVWPIPAQAMGAVSAVVSLAMLGVAAKLSIALSGLSPPGDDEDTPIDVGAAAVTRGHDTLTGLLVGFSAAAASGAVVAAIAGHLGEAGHRAVTLTAVVGVVLMLRARHQIVVTRMAAVFASGLLCLTVAVVLVALSMPRQAHWLCALAVVGGVGLLFLTMARIDATVSPVARRCVELLEYLALVAVIPLACWVADLFGVVRGLSLT
jgi:type VII secretion integral membrane protein EccD